MSTSYNYTKLCPACKAENRPLAAECWQCHASLKGVPLATGMPAGEPPPGSAAPTSTSSGKGGPLTAVLLGSAVAVVVGGYCCSLGYMIAGIAYGSLAIGLSCLVAYAVRGRAVQVEGEQSRKWVGPLAATAALLVIFLIMLPIAFIMSIFLVCWR